MMGSINPNISSGVPANQPPYRAGGNKQPEDTRLRDGAMAGTVLGAALGGVAYAAAPDVYHLPNNGPDVFVRTTPNGEKLVHWFEGGKVKDPNFPEFESFQFRNNVHYNANGELASVGGNNVVIARDPASSFKRSYGFIPKLPGTEAIEGTPHVGKLTHTLDNGKNRAFWEIPKGQTPEHFLEMSVTDAKNLDKVHYRVMPDPKNGGHMVMVPSAVDSSIHFGMPLNAEGKIDLNGGPLKLKQLKLENTVKAEADIASKVFGRPVKVDKSLLQWVSQEVMSTDELGKHAPWLTQQNGAWQLAEEMKGKQYLDLSDLTSYRQSVSNTTEFAENTLKKALSEGKADKALRWKAAGTAAAAVFLAATLGWGLLGPKATPTRTAENL
jgi:hypothetical protein